MSARLKLSPLPPLVGAKAHRIAQWAAHRGPELRLALGVLRDPLEPRSRAWKDAGGPFAPERYGMAPTDSDRRVAIDLFNRAKLATLAPAAQEPLESIWYEAVKMARARGLEVVIWEAVRALERQVVLVAEGASKTPTSRHLFGYGTDSWMYVIGEGVQFKHPAWWKDIGAKAKAFGLTWGGSWKGFPDAPHFELRQSAWSAAASQWKAALDAEWKRLFT